MQCIYEAATALEAHMILNLLEQEGLKGRVDGDYLQGGIGELQAVGLVRVLVAEADIPKAKELIKAWDESQKNSEVTPRQKKNNSLGMFLLGSIFGAVFVAIFYNTPVTMDGVDYNGDGELDEKWYYVDYRASKTELDRNLDGKVDYIYTFDRRGLAEKSQSDDNFDGIFESESYFDNGNIQRTKVDTDGDAFADYHVDFSNGLANTIKFIDPETRKAIKIQYYGDFNITVEEIDTDGDGVLDTRRQFDSLEEVVSIKKIEANQ